MSRKNSYGRRQKFSLTPKMVLLYLCLIPLSILIGFGIFMGARVVEKKIYVKDYTEYVEQYATEYNLPPETVYAVIYSESRFQSNKESLGGHVGLMGLTRDEFMWIGENLLHEHPDAGLIYNPETNIRYGCAYLSYLFDRYLLWDTAITAYSTSTDVVDNWLKDAKLVDKTYGALRADSIPDKDTQKHVKSILKTIEKYKEL